MENAVFLVVRFCSSSQILRRISYQSLREKCPNTEFFLVRIFLYSDWIRRFTVNLRIQSEHRKIRTRKNFVFGHFSRSAKFSTPVQFSWISLVCSKYFVHGVFCHSISTSIKNIHFKVLTVFKNGGLVQWLHTEGGQQRGHLLSSGPSRKK